MIKTVSPRPLGGTVSAIASKSHVHRLLICAALSREPTHIRCSHTGRDVEATVSCLQALGAQITEHDHGFSVVPGKAPGFCRLFCGESGSTLRFLLPVAAALGVEAEFVMEGRLPRRPMSPLDAQLEEHGVTLSRPQDQILRCGGKLTGGDFVLPGHVSSQFLTGLLLAMPLLDVPCTLQVTSPLQSAPYVALTVDALKQFGVTIVEETDSYTVFPTTLRSPDAAVAEGDWSNAAFWLTAGALSRPVTVTGLNLQSLHGDRAVCDLLAQMGAEVSFGTDSVTVSPAALKGITIDAAQIPDLVPVLAAAACAADGTTVFAHTARLRLKESDRAAAICRMIAALGGEAEEEEDRLLIHGGRPLSGGTVDSCGDHRIAMAAAVASAVSTGPVTVLGAEAVEKSYLRFWTDFQELQHHL